MSAELIDLNNQIRQGIHSYLTTHDHDIQTEGLNQLEEKVQLPQKTIEFLIKRETTFIDDVRCRVGDSLTTACYRLEIIKQTGSADLPKEIVEVINDTTKISGDDLTIAAINKEEAK